MQFACQPLSQTCFWLERPRDLIAQSKGRHVRCPKPERSQGAGIQFTFDVLREIPDGRLATNQDMPSGLILWHATIDEVLPEIRIGACCPMAVRGRRSTVLP